MQPRSERWVGLDHETVLRLVVSDMDGLEAAVDHLATTVESKMNGLTKVLIGILVSVATASILLAINLAVLGGGQ